MMNHALLFILIGATLLIAGFFGARVGLIVGGMFFVFYGLFAIDVGGP